METGLFTITELAQKLGYSGVSAVSNWKRRGIEWKRVLDAFPSLDVSYVKTGRRSGFNESELPASYFQIKDHVERNGIDDKDMDLILSMIASRSETLERELGELRRLIVLLMRFWKRE